MINNTNIEEAKLKVSLKKYLFKELLGIIIVSDHDELSEEEIIFIAEGAIKSFKEKYLTSKETIQDKAKEFNNMPAPIDLVNIADEDLDEKLNQEYQDENREEGEDEE